MATVKYRLSSGQVVLISLHNQPLLPQESAYYGLLIDPSFPDGTDNREPLDDEMLGPLLVLGWQKIAVPETNTVRNATQSEIDQFPTAEAEEHAARDATQATSMVDAHPLFRKIFKAILKRIIVLFNGTNTRTNQTADWVSAFKAEVAASSNLADFKTRVASLPDIPSDLPESITLDQAINALKNDISSGD